MFSSQMRAIAQTGLLVFCLTFVTGEVVPEFPTDPAVPVEVVPYVGTLDGADPADDGSSDGPEAYASPTYAPTYAPSYSPTEAPTYSPTPAENYYR